MTVSPWVGLEFIVPTHYAMQGVLLTLCNPPLIVGVAYILKLVDQYHAFDSLHWFDSVRAKYEADKVSKLELINETRLHQSLTSSLALFEKLLDFKQLSRRCWHTIHSFQAPYKLVSMDLSNKKNRPSEPSCNTAEVSFRES